MSGCRNTQERIAELFDRLDALRANTSREWKVVLVDDASTDNTLAALLMSSHGREWAQVVHQAVESGMGGAIRTALAHASTRVICTVDSESDYPLARLNDLASIIEDGAGLVSSVGKRPAEPRDRSSSLRELATDRVSRLSLTVTGCDLQTLTCPFCAYRREVLERLALRADGRRSQVEIMIRAFASGVDVRLAPVGTGSGQREAKGDDIGVMLAAAIALVLLRCRMVMRGLVDGRSTVTRAVRAKLTNPVTLVLSADSVAKDLNGTNGVHFRDRKEDAVAN